jgi:hypothetical protein
VTFLERAKPYAEMGIPIFPLLPREKRPPASLSDWPNVATTNIAQIEAWNAENPDFNCALVAQPSGIVILEFDVANGMANAAREMNQPLPKTRVHISGGGFGHYIFLQTDRSRALGNRQAKKPEGGEWFSFRQNRMYVVGPGSVHPNGNEYGVARDVPPIPLPDWLADWVEKHSSPNAVPKEARPVDDDFDFDELMDHYGIAIVRDNGPWQITDVCPVVGYRHQHSVATGFYWDGESLGFKCFAQGCDGSSMSIGQVLKSLNQDHEPYRGAIWEELDTDQLCEGDSTEPERAPALSTFSKVFPKAVEVSAVADALAKEPCYAAARTGCQCGGEHKYPQTFLSTERRAQIDALLVAEEEEQEDQEAEVKPESEPTQRTADEVIAYLCDAKLSKTMYVEESEPTVLPPGAAYGQMAEWARGTELPMEIAYVAVLTCFSALLKYDEILGVRFNLFTALLMPVGAGKNLALSRSCTVLEMRDGLDYMDATMGGVGGLFAVLGNKTEGKGRDKIEIPGPRKMLISPAEFAATMANMKIENSTLATHLCNLWDKNQITLPVREGKRDINCRVSILGALPVDKAHPEGFTRYFGEETGAGLHSRFLLGYSDTKLDHRWAERWTWNPPTPEDFADYVLPQVPPIGWTKEAEDYYTDLELPYDEDGRGLYNLKRIVLLAATANGDQYVTLECLRSAELFMLWQLRLKRFFQAGSAETISQGELSTLILNTLARIDAEGKYERSPVINGNLNINVTRVIHQNNWKRFGIEAVQRTIASLVKSGLLQQGFRLNTQSKIVLSKYHVVVSRFA